MWSALFVFVGAALWATDTLFRVPLVQELSAVTIVYYEHIFATVLSFIWVLIASGKKALFPGWKQILGAVLIGVFGSAIATILFTESFRYTNPSVTILLQKMQPILVILFSAAFLGERITRGFIGWSLLAVCSAFVLSFPKGFHSQTLLNHANIGAVLAFLAALFWAVSTVVGKWVLRTMDENVLSFWRFLSGMATLMLISSRIGQARIEIPFALSNTEVMGSLAFMAFIPGFIAMILYYRGLRGVPASIATLLELSFPLTAVWVNARYLGLSLAPVQLIAMAVLLGSMVGVSRSVRSGI
ncbi:MAG: DMT family transporter [Proteobacteria bacterium]|nr:DMT family transporter [Pseudomonadota bacterium]